VSGIKDDACAVTGHCGVLNLKFAALAGPMEANRRSMQNSKVLDEAVLCRRPRGAVPLVATTITSLK
jgi:hypothetical protein